MIALIGISVLVSVVLALVFIRNAKGHARRYAADILKSMKSH